MKQEIGITIELDIKPRVWYKMKAYIINKLMYPWLIIKWKKKK